MVEFCITCYNFQRRLQFQLQSILEQVNPPDILVNIAYVKDNGFPTIEDIIYKYKSLGLNIKSTVQDFDNIMRRGCTRMIQLKESDSEWIYFADCDIVYHPEFFMKLFNIIKDSTKEYCYSSVAKIHTCIPETNELVINPPPKNVYDFCLYNLPSMKGSYRCSAKGGGMYVGRRDVLLSKTNCIYGSKRIEIKHDVCFGMYMINDVRFRNQINVKNIRGLPPQIHLNHLRYKECPESFGLQK